MEGSITGRERRKYPRIVINLPLEYQEREEDPSLRGAMVVNVSKGGFLIESTRDMPVGTELSITLLYSREFELTSFKAVTKIVRKEPYSKENSNGNQVWEGYLYGLEFIQISDEDHRKLNWLLGGQFEFEETFLSLFCQP
jgi:c-di-GMP-binding flagellar brake protein YcgR